jgi:hypothetical protein
MAFNKTPPDAVLSFSSPSINIGVAQRASILTMSATSPTRAPDIEASLVKLEPHALAPASSARSPRTASG